MSHGRVLICRVEDDDEQMTERASVDLPPVCALVGSPAGHPGGASDHSREASGFSMQGAEGVSAGVS